MIRWFSKMWFSISLGILIIYIFFFEKHIHVLRQVPVRDIRSIKNIQFLLTCQFRLHQELFFKVTFSYDIWKSLKHMTTALSKYITNKKPQMEYRILWFYSIQKEKKSNPIIFNILLISELTNTTVENIFFSFYSCKLFFVRNWKKNQIL